VSLADSWPSCYIRTDPPVNSCLAHLYSRQNVNILLLLARLLRQYCFACWRLSSLSVVCNAAGRRVVQPPGVWMVEWPTLHGGPVQLHPVRVTPCYLSLLLSNDLLVFNFCLTGHISQVAPHLGCILYEESLVNAACFLRVRRPTNKINLPTLTQWLLTYSSCLTNHFHHSLPSFLRTSFSHLGLAPDRLCRLVIFYLAPFFSLFSVCGCLWQIKLLSVSTLVTPNVSYHIIS